MAMFKPKQPTDQEVQEILKHTEQNKLGVMTAQPGDRVTVVKGPFEGFSGVVDQVDYDRKVITVSTNIFGRVTPLQFSPTEIH